MSPPPITNLSPHFWANGQIFWFKIHLLCSMILIIFPKSKERVGCLYGHLFNIGYTVPFNLNWIMWTANMYWCYLLLKIINLSLLNVLFQLPSYRTASSCPLPLLTCLRYSSWHPPPLTKSSPSQSTIGVSTSCHKPAHKQARVSNLINVSVCISKP